LPEPLQHLVEVGLAEPSETVPYGAKTFRRQLQYKLTAAAAAADAGYTDIEGLVTDPTTGIPSLKTHRSEGQDPRRTNMGPYEAARHIPALSESFRVGADASASEAVPGGELHQILSQLPSGFAALFGMSELSA
jgi:hypothetical protein